jgi:phenylacetate-CoA ligase
MLAKNKIPEIELKSKEEIRSYQNERLSELMQYVNKHSKFYQNRFKVKGIDIATIRTIDDLQKLPVTTKDDLQNHGEDFLCVTKDKIIDYVTTSGTLGDPVSFPMSSKDLDRLTYNEFISFACAHTDESDIYQMMLTLDKRFMAGMAYYLGLKEHGAGIIRNGPGSAKLQFDSINRFKPTALVTVPSFIPKLIDYAEKNNIDLNKTSVKKAVCIGEPIRNVDFSLNTLGKKIKEKWDIKLYSTYASTEMGTAFTECEMGKGGHHHPELLIVEFLDENNNPVGPNEAGEVTVTTLGVEAMPLLRFKTGDICYHYDDKCECGRNTTRLGPVIGRRQQMLKFKGTSLYPPAIYDVLNELNEVENYLVEVTTGDLGTDDIKVIVGSHQKSEAFIKTLKEAFKVKLRVTPRVEIADPKIVHQQLFANESRKPMVFRDLR